MRVVGFTARRVGMALLMALLMTALTATQRVWAACMLCLSRANSGQISVEGGA